MGPRAAEIAQAFVSSQACPDEARDDPLLMDAILAWAHAVAEAERLRAYRDVLDEQMGADAVAEFLTETTEAVEDVSRPMPGAEKRSSLIRQRESLGRALHRAESRARTLRNDLRKHLAGQAGGRAIDLAAYWAERAAERGEASGEG
jgi:hypothetical protein